MNVKPLHPTFRLFASGILSVVVLFAFGLTGRDSGWTVALGGAAAGAFVLLIPVLVRGNSWQKMVAGIMLFVPSFGLALSVYAVVTSL